MNFKQLAAGYFASHPSVGEFHFTSDGQAFIKPTDAETHSRSLEDKSITAIKRGETASKEDQGEVTQDEGDQAAELAAPAATEAKATNPEKAKGRAASKK